MIASTLLLLVSSAGAYELLGYAWAPEDFRSHSDAVALRARGILPIICGPGDRGRSRTRNTFRRFSTSIAPDTIHL